MEKKTKTSGNILKVCDIHILFHFADKIEYFLKRFYLERGKGRETEGEKNINAREKHWLVAYLTGPEPGTEPANPASALTVNQPVTFHFMTPNQLSHTGQG